jgi:hypothetical protein
MRRIALVDHASLPPEEQALLTSVVAEHRGLDDIFAWGRLQSPKVVPADVIKQDEFTHDVLVPLASGAGSSMAPPDWARSKGSRSGTTNLPRRRFWKSGWKLAGLRLRVSSRKGMLLTGMPRASIGALSSLEGRVE